MLSKLKSEFIVTKIKLFRVFLLAIMLINLIIKKKYDFLKNYINSNISIYIMNSSLDLDKLMKALDNENNEGILDTNNQSISKIKNDILQQLHLSREKLIKMHKSLKDYKYVDDLKDINYGCYIRYISLKDPKNIKLTIGGIVCDIKIIDDGILVICKNNFNKYFQLNMDENLIFQKLTDQEKVLLSVVDYLNK